MNRAAKQVSYALARTKVGAAAGRRWRPLAELETRTVMGKMVAAGQLERRVVKSTGAVVFRRAA